RVVVIPAVPLIEGLPLAGRQQGQLGRVGVDEAAPALQRGLRGTAGLQLGGPNCGWYPPFSAPRGRRITGKGITSPASPPPAARPCGPPPGPAPGRWRPGRAGPPPPPAGGGPAGGGGAAARPGPAANAPRAPLPGRARGCVAIRRRLPRSFLSPRSWGRAHSR